MGEVLNESEFGRTILPIGEGALNLFIYYPHRENNPLLSVSSGQDDIFSRLALFGRKAAAATSARFRRRGPSSSCTYNTYARKMPGTLTLPSRPLYAFQRFFDRFWLSGQIGN